MKNKWNVFTYIAILSMGPILFFPCREPSNNTPSHVGNISDLDDPKLREAVFQIAWDETDLVVMQQFSYGMLLLYQSRLGT